MKVYQLCAVDFTLERFLLPLIDGIATSVWDITAVCSDVPSILSLRERGYRICSVPIARCVISIATLRSLFLLWRLFRRERFDILHAHWLLGALVTVLKLFVKSRRLPTGEN